MTYVAQYFHAFSHLGGSLNSQSDKIDRVETAGRRVERFAEVSLSVWEMRHSYEHKMKAVLNILLRWLIIVTGEYGTSAERVDRGDV